MSVAAAAPASFSSQDSPQASPPGHAPALAYRADIDGLRAIAVGAVVIFHAVPSLLPGGFVGVDIFFVISGFLISTILFKEVWRGDFSLVRFYDRRIRRIFPALIAVLVATLAAGWWLLFNSEYETLGRHVGAASSFVENFLLWGESGYFDVASQKKPLLHLWSLAIEEQYYIVWPLFLYALHRFRLNALAVIGIVALLSFAYCLNASFAATPDAYYSPLSRSWELMVGSALAFLRLRHPGLFTQRADLLSCAGLLLIAVSLAAINESSVFPGWLALLPTFGAALLIAAGPEGLANRRLLSLRPMVWLGLISYPLYLWHWPLLAYANIVFPYVGPKRALVLVLLAVVLAAATYRCIELPLKQWKGGLRQPALLAAGMVVVLSTGVGIAWFQVPARQSNVREPVGNEWGFLQIQSGQSTPNMNGRYVLGGDRPAETLFIGDSQLAQYAERLSLAAARDDHLKSAVMEIGGGCVPIDNVFTDDPRRDACWQTRSDGMALAGSASMQNIVVGGSWNWYFFNPQFYFRDGSRKLPLVDPEGRRLALSTLEGQLRALGAGGRRVFFVLGNPSDRRFEMPSSVGARLLPGSKAALANDPFNLPEPQLALRQELIALAQRAGATVVDPFPLICPGGQCRRLAPDGTPVFNDESHFNPPFIAAHGGFVDVVLN